MTTQTTELFHGSHDDALTTIRPDGLFGGLFCSSERRSAESHGRHVYVCEIDDDAICSTQILNYHADPAAIDRVLADEYGETSDEVWARVVDERHDDLDADEAWDAQRVRGLIAAALGFRAVECDDEHGTSWLVLPGVEIVRIDD